MLKRVPGTLLNDFPEMSAERFPQKTALICGKEKYTYAHLDDVANQLAHALQKQGVKKGDRIAAFFDNSFELMASIFAILKAGAAFVIVNHQTKSPKLCYILNNCRAKGILIHSKFSGILQDVEQRVPSHEFAIVSGAAEVAAGDAKRLSWNDVLAAFPSSRPDLEIIDLDLSAIIYTSGTTGFPKGVCFNHRAMVSVTRSINAYLENSESDIILNALPLSYVYGLYQVMLATHAGATLALEKSFAYPYQIVQALEREKATAFPGVPTAFALLLSLKDIKKRDFGSVRYITNAAAALPPSHIFELKEVFSQAKIFSMYGITECKRVSYMPPEELERRPSSVGKGIPNEEIYIVDENGNPVPPGTVGELVVRGSNVMMGYWEMPEETAKALRPGKYPGERVLYTGDLFRMDDGGYLYFVSRKDDIIKSRGEKVAPKEIEHVIYELSEVLEAAVIGVPDDILGEAIKAFIVLKDGTPLCERDIITHCSRRLENFMVPKYIEFRPELPKTTSGKIRKLDLIETAGRDARN